MWFCVLMKGINSLFSKVQVHLAVVLSGVTEMFGCKCPHPEQGDAGGSQQILISPCLSFLFSDVLW